MSHEFSQGQIEQEMPSLSLLDQYAETIVTFRGITAPLGALINLCPIPKDQMDQSKIDNWTGAILEESGIDYKSERIQQESDNKQAELSKKKLKK